MSGLYFLGIKKSTIKKLPPFKYLFDWRDKNIYQTAFRQLSEKYKIEDVSEKEAVLHFPLNNKTSQLLFRKFPVSDLSVLNQVFEQKAYSPIVERILKTHNPADALKIVDAGGNVGYSAVYFHAFFPNAEITVIEPESSNARQLEKNMKRNTIQLKRFINGALWHKTATLEVVRDFRDNREAAFTVRETNGPGINGQSFASILAQNNWEKADLVKIDIEGGERFLFDTDEKADEILSRTRYLAIEIHDEFNIRETIYSHLNRNGFTHFEFNDLTLAVKE